MSMMDLYLYVRMMCGRTWVCFSARCTQTRLFRRVEGWGGLDTCSELISGHPQLVVWIVVLGQRYSCRTARGKSGQNNAQSKPTTRLYHHLSTVKIPFVGMVAILENGLLYLSLYSPAMFPMDHQSTPIHITSHHHLPIRIPATCAVLVLWRGMELSMA